MRRMLALVLSLCLLSGCAPQAPEDRRTHILCTTYPVYLLTTALAGDDPDLTVELLVDQQISCLHDYTLTVKDMKAVDRSDLIIMNGAGLEKFLSDALSQKDVPVIDCSADLDLLPSREEGHYHRGGGHDHEEGEWDPHVWMDPRQYAHMAEVIAAGLDRELGGDRFQRACPAVRGPLLEAWDTWRSALEDLHGAGLVTFHDGFQYFAAAFGLDLLKAIEEEEGAETSARELQEIISLVERRGLKAIFVERNGSDRSAGVIARETGCQVLSLDMVMSGDGRGLEPYLEAMEHNVRTIEEALG